MGYGREDLRKSLLTIEEVKEPLSDLGLALRSILSLTLIFITGSESDQMKNGNSGIWQFISEEWLKFYRKLSPLGQRNGFGERMVVSFRSGVWKFPNEKLPHLEVLVEVGDVNEVSSHGID